MFSASWDKMVRVVDLQANKVTKSFVASKEAIKAMIVTDKYIFVAGCDPNIRGYSACLNKSVLYLHAHREGESLEFYSIFPSNTLWIHMPVGLGEFITDIWIQTSYWNKTLLVSERLTNFLGLSDLFED